jgi:hypothetical protein
LKILKFFFSGAGAAQKCTGTGFAILDNTLKRVKITIRVTSKQGNPI